MLYLGNSELAIANLSERSRLELHLLDGAAVVVSGAMTAGEIIRVSSALQGLASELLTALGTACERCDNCGAEVPCERMTGVIQPDIRIPPDALAEAGIDPDSKGERYTSWKQIMTAI